MSDLARGRTIYESRIEYPLPTKSVRDYIVYLVPAADLYGNGTRQFFGKFYPHHRPVTREVSPVVREVSSFEEMFDLLYADVQHGVSLTRELVLVGHATPQGLLIPLLGASAPSGSGRYRDVSACSLALLQKEPPTPALTRFKDRRKAVVACLREESWVTIRGCRLGRAATPIAAHALGHHTGQAVEAPAQIDGLDADERPPRHAGSCSAPRGDHRQHSGAACMAARARDGRRARRRFPPASRSALKARPETRPWPSSRPQGRRHLLGSWQCPTAARTSACTLTAK